MIALHILAAAAGAFLMVFSLMVATTMVPDLRTDHGWQLWTYIAATIGVCLAGLLVLMWGLGVLR